MRELTARERGYIDSLRPAFAALVTALRDEIATACERETCHVLITCGARSPAQQLARWKQGRETHPNRSPLHRASWRVVGDVATYAFPGSSAHEYGLAVDMPLLDDVTGHWLADNDERWLRVLVARVRAVAEMESGHYFRRWSTATRRHVPWHDTAHVQMLGWRAMR